MTTHDLSTPGPNWASRLAVTCGKARPGDVIVVPTPAQAELARTALRRLGNEASIMVRVRPVPVSATGDG